MLKKFPKGSQEQVGKYFKACEMDCPCKCCTETLIDLRLPLLLDIMRMKLGKPIRINSGYRCANHQEELREQGYETAKGPSTHSMGEAVDIAVEGCSGAMLELRAREAGFESVGCAVHWIHADLRPGPKSWIYKSR